MKNDSLLMSEYMAKLCGYYRKERLNMSKFICGFFIGGMVYTATTYILFKKGVLR